MVVLDNGITQNFVACFVDLLVHCLAFARHFDLHVLANVHRSNAAEAHMLERALDGFSLRIENGLFWRNYYFCFHQERNFLLANRMFGKNPPVRNQKPTGALRKDEGFRVKFHISLTNGKRAAARDGNRPFGRVTLHQSQARGDTQTRRGLATQ